MTHKEETYIINYIEQIRDETHENNIMLRQICNAINHFLRNHNQENIDDFSRNVLANMFSNVFDFSKLFKR